MFFFGSVAQLANHALLANWRGGSLLHNSMLVCPASGRA